MAASIEETSVAHFPMISDGVPAHTIRTIWACSVAAGPWRRFVNWPVPIPSNRFTWLRKSWWDIVLPSIRLGLLVNPWEIRMRRLAIAIVRFVFLKPKAELHMVLQQLWSDFLVSIQHDTLVNAAFQPTDILR